SAEATGAGRVGGLAPADKEVSAPARSTFAPHSGQNFAVAGMASPQAGQARGNGAPHSMQNWSPSGTSAPQLGHRMPYMTRIDRLQRSSLFVSQPHLVADLASDHSIADVEVVQQTHLDLGAYRERAILEAIAHKGEAHPHIVKHAVG